MRTSIRKSAVQLICTQDGVGIESEIKYVGDGSLEKGCADALDQIGERKYAESLEQQGL